MSVEYVSGTILSVYYFIGASQHSTFTRGGRYGEMPKVTQLMRKNSQNLNPG